ncbi:MAG TPA: hypothetical protein VIL46_09435 [Gemmataceae bacterium]
MRFVMLCLMAGLLIADAGLPGCGPRPTLPKRPVPAEEVQEPAESKPAKQTPTKAEQQND